MRKSNWLKSVVVAMLVLIVGFCINIGSGTKVHAANILHPMPINQIFPDPDLAKVVKRTLGKQSVTDVVSQKELDSVQVLNGNESNIKSLEGLQHFNKLEVLFLASNQIKDITPLKNLTNLKVLDLKVNQISDLTPLYGLKNLTSLDVVYQKIVETPVTYEPDLVIPVTVKKPDGSLVTPKCITDNGAYIYDDIIWNLPAYKKEVSYKFGERIQVGKVSTTFTGMVKQPLTR
ncbi:internalin N-terminal domain-containing protein [Listeria ivanovii]|uniref:internalin N-terminal domain-containing protein n=1 Tax=Listeria ivanovii TaxID=1638 RepID=UPI00190A8E23|nr:internalin N-terminal domain-containing protein [Listeria ivanovii]MBK3914669.1 leucine-rich repeat protein [Listeria ivanovii subsp. ivanovii]MBK3921433.1 leucine-rich repeat protein [Listeria ivanovii subsp. ivanovii]MBK3926597.1 leucine-rich repeat protein [Listeria ivanovii subsp. ivanovii]